MSIQEKKNRKYIDNEYPVHNMISFIADIYKKKNLRDFPFISSAC